MILTAFPDFQAIQTNDFNYLSYLIPSILGMSLMQGGVFAAIPLVADREKLILKRLGATPLRRWQLVGFTAIGRPPCAIARRSVIRRRTAALLRSLPPHWIRRHGGHREDARFRPQANAEIRGPTCPRRITNEGHAHTGS